MCSITLSLSVTAKACCGREAMLLTEASSTRPESGIFNTILTTMGRVPASLRLW